MSRSAGLLLAAVLGLIVFAADQLTKLLVESSMVLNESRPVLGDVFHLTYIQNSGGAFGLLAGSQLLLMVGSAVALGVVAWMLLVQPPSRAMASGGGLVLGGAAGNLLDRLSSSGVTDYLDLRVWPIFNLADVAIVCGVALLVVNALFNQEPREKG
jgi:signal peptidase II